MGWHLWVTLTVIALMIAAMARNISSPDIILVAGLTLLLLCGIVSPEQAFAGFANPAVITLAALFVVAAGMRETGALDWVATRILGHPGSVVSAQLRLMIPAALLSVFLNNTPVVAMMVPLVSEWARRHDLRRSQLMIPLSYATILGGTCSLLGTSTNLVLAELVTQQQPGLEVGMFDVAYLGIPALLVGMLYVVLMARRLLPSQMAVGQSLKHPREYMLIMRVEAKSSVVGKSVEEAGLRHLPGLFLVEVEREGTTLTAVAPHTRLAAGDRLCFAGLVDGLVDLRNIRGLVPDTNQVDKLTGNPDRNLVEAVVAMRSPLVGRNARQANFRNHYNAAIIAVHRHGQRVRAKVGDIVFEPGDTLLLETSPSFVRNHRNDASFALVSRVEGSTPRRYGRAWLAGGLLITMVLLNLSGLLALLPAALMSAGLMIILRCVRTHEARQAIDLPILITIAAAFGLGEALHSSGAATLLATGIKELATPLGSMGLLALLYLATSLLSAIVSNTAAAVLMFPIAAAAAPADMPALAYTLVLMLAAATSLATPIGYQTNLMVYGPGGYRFADFLRFGLPLQLLIALVVIPLVALRL